MKTREFVDILKDNGIFQVSAVPCSVLNGLIKTMEEDEDIKYIPMNREDNLISWAMGVSLSGEKPFVMMQNSGIGNIIDVLISLQQTYRVPLVMLITWRGYEKKDEVQHWIWGDVQNKILDALHIPYTILKKENEKIREDVIKSIKFSYEFKMPVALILKRGGYIDEEK